jgi:hypothetical protein
MLLQTLLAREHSSSTLDVGYYSSEARTSINLVVSCANHPSPTQDRYKYYCPAVENPDMKSIGCLMQSLLGLVVMLI